MKHTEEDMRAIFESLETKHLENIIARRQAWIEMQKDIIKAQEATISMIRGIIQEREN